VAAVVAELGVVVEATGNMTTRTFTLVFVVAAGSVFGQATKQQASQKTFDTLTPRPRR